MRQKYHLEGKTRYEIKTSAHVTYSNPVNGECEWNIEAMTFYGKAMVFNYVTEKDMYHILYLLSSHIPT